MKDVNNLPPLMAEGKNSKKRSTRGKSFGYQVLGFGAGGAGAPMVVATGGTITCSGDYKIHTFTGPGTFCVSQIAKCAAENVVSYMVVAGGGGGGKIDGAGGGGAGGFREYKNTCDPYTASPLNGNPGGTAITVSVSPYPITVGGGGTVSTPVPTAANKGADSIFSSITSTGGGQGGASSAGLPGGSGGGGSNGGGAGGCGNTPPTTPAQGTNGGTGAPGSGVMDAGRGGGGATTAANSFPSPGSGGPGAPTCISGTPTTYGGGGGGGTCRGPGYYGGGSGGGGKGGRAPNPSCGPEQLAQPGGTNLGGGGGGNGYTPRTGGTGGSGVVIIRYKFQ